MERLNRRDYQILVEFLRELESIDESQPFAVRLLPMLQRLVPYDVITYNEVDLGRGRNPTIAYPAETMPADAERLFRPFIAEHPIISHIERTHDRQARKLSDFISLRQFQQLGIYRDFFRLVGVEHQIALTLPAPSPVVLGIALNRHARDFSERERLLLNLSRPYLIEAHRRSETRLRLHQMLKALEQGLEADARGVVLHGGNGRGSRMTAEEPLPEHGHLTERESEVLRLLTQGKTDRQIAEQLAVSRRTVQKHVEHLLAKLGVPNRTAAAARVLGLGPQEE